MAEVYSGLEAYIYRVGTASGDTTEAAIDAYGEGVSVTLSREFRERKDSSGVLQHRFCVGTNVEMTINKLYSDDPFLFDGNNVKIYLMNSIATQTYQLTGAFWSNKGWSMPGDDIAKYDVSISGKGFGTI